MLDLSNKTAIVAGGSGLIGRIVIEALKEQGAKTYNADITDSDIYLDINSLVSLAYMIRGYGPIQIFVNCAYPRNSTAHGEGFCLCTEKMAEHMADHGGGVIINLASIYGVMGPDYRIYENTGMTMPPRYAFVKGGIIAHSRCIAAKYGKYNVRVLCVSPGGVLDKQSKTFVKRYCDKVPVGRMASPRDIANVIVMLVADEAKYITGQNVIIDGGLTSSI